MEKGESHHDFPLCTNQLSHGQGFLRENELRLLLGAFFVGQALQGMTHIENPRIGLDEWPKGE